ncbi:hypothetical protein CANARDRAFT_198347 [[Candida] arabinofermentans NRRL YB-2248]|uniref:Origin recognition complex subunit 5 n=1 Tax=[Candida] arabinofermentans NRRL YB-2248 TaxID=983967 RepID=A0A1E4T173_9ASCO|nr:hypothetical protein CANARDRAFT_198347 [[Candida] arabinofermentans NRRL YB-2248]
MDLDSLHDVVAGCENIHNFIEVLKHLIQFSESDLNKGEKFGKPIVFVMDRIERLLASENPAELCAALSRLHEQSPLLSNISFVYVVNRSDFLNLSTFGIPIVKFDPYSSSQVKDILVNSMLETDWLTHINNEMKSGTTTITQLKNFINHYVVLILDTYSSFIGTDLNLSLAVLTKLWPIFYDPLVKLGKIEASVNDVLTTYTANKKLLQSEYALIDNLTGSENDFHASNPTGERKKGNYDLPNKTKYILIASYLASFGNPNHDYVLYSKEKDVRLNRKVTWTKRRKTNGSGSKKETGTKMIAQPFALERLLAILRAIYDDYQEQDPLFNDIELMNELATLSSLKSIDKLKIGDTIGGTTKWRCNVSWDVIKKFSEDVSFEVEEYLAEY